METPYSKEILRRQHHRNISNFVFFVLFCITVTLMAVPGKLYFIPVFPAVISVAYSLIQSFKISNLRSNEQDWIIDQAITNLKKLVRYCLPTDQEK